uniref:Uncharacterized protein n=1 Tax=Tanacetum cinerariifolium TaxID=118510 RepID=A0A699JFF8_TANCI|nr:hypothetical protein [Tanacetum cinerariifolium]
MQRVQLFQTSMNSGRSLLLCVRIVMTSRPRIRIPSMPRLGDHRPLGLFSIPTVIHSISMVAQETSTDAPVISFAAPVVETTIVASPTGLCSLVPYSDLDSDSPDEIASPEYITPLPATSPFLYTDSPEASDYFDGPPSQDPYAIIVTCWRSRTCLEACITSFFRSPPIFFYFTYEFFASSFFGYGCTGQAHSGSLTRVVSPRLGYPLVRAPRHSDAFRRWCAALLFTFYPPTTSKSSLGDSSERPLHSPSHTAGPSRKRCRSPTDYVPSSTPVTRSLAPTRADLLPPRKRFRDSYSSETSMEEDIEIDTTKTEDGRELDIVDGDDVRDHIKVNPRDDMEEFEANVGDTVVLGIDSRSVPMVDEEIVEPVGGDSSSSSGTKDGIVRQLEADQIIASGVRAGMAESIWSLRSENLKVRTLLYIERDRMDRLRLHMSHSQEEFRQIRNDRDDLRRQLRRLESIAERHLGFHP